MSKMSNINLELQEYANDLGYSTVQDALDDGYNAVQDLVTGGWSLQRVNMAQEQEKAHEAWLKEKRNLIHEVEMLINDTPYQVYKDTLRKVVKFIEGVSHE